MPQPAQRASKESTSSVRWRAAVTRLDFAPSPNLPAPAGASALNDNAAPSALISTCFPPFEPARESSREDYRRGGHLEQRIYEAIGYIHDWLYLPRPSISVTFRQLEVFVKEAAKGHSFPQDPRTASASASLLSAIEIRALERRSAGGRRAVRARVEARTPRMSARGIEDAGGGTQQLLASKGRLVPRREARASKERLRLRIGAGPYLLDHIIRSCYLPRFLRGSSGRRARTSCPHQREPEGHTSLRRAVRRKQKRTSLCSPRWAGLRASEWAPNISATYPALSMPGAPRLARAGRPARAICNRRVAAGIPALPLESSDMKRWMLRVAQKRHLSGQSRCSIAVRRCDCGHDHRQSGHLGAVRRAHAALRACGTCCPSARL